MAPAEGADDKAEPNVAAQALQSSDGSDGGASDDKEDEEETKFVEWDPTGRFGRVRDPPPPLKRDRDCFPCFSCDCFDRASPRGSPSFASYFADLIQRLTIVSLFLFPPPSRFADAHSSRARDVQERVHGV